MPNSPNISISKNPRNLKLHNRNDYIYNSNLHNRISFEKPTTPQKNILSFRDNNSSPRRNLLHHPPSLRNRSILHLLHDNRHPLNPSPHNHNHNKKTMRLTIKAQPNSSRQEIQTNLEGKITKVFLKKPAKENKANIELEKFLSKHLKKKVKVIKGHTSKNKTIEIL